MRMLIAHYEGDPYFEQFEVSIPDTSSFPKFAEAMEKLIQATWGFEVTIERKEASGQTPKGAE